MTASVSLHSHAIPRQDPGDFASQLVIASAGLVEESLAVARLMLKRKLAELLNLFQSFRSHRLAMSCMIEFKLELALRLLTAVLQFVSHTIQEFKARNVSITPRW